MQYESVQIIKNEQIAPSVYKLRLNGGSHYAKSGPGQFIMIRFAGQLTPLLSRPFSIHQIIWDNDESVGLEILIKVVGNFTRQLSRAKAGTPLQLLGPLGNGFRISKDHRRVYIVAGGIGVAPMPFLVSYLKKRSLDLSESAAFIGGQSKADIVCTETFAGEKMGLTITTDDGSSGDQCLVTHPLEIAVGQQSPDVIFACGPKAMLQCVVGIADKYKVACQVSLETVMACGMGACLGCALPTSDNTGTYKHVCLDGPVFDARIIAETL